MTNINEYGEIKDGHDNIKEMVDLIALEDVRKYLQKPQLIILEVLLLLCHIHSMEKIHLSYRY